MFAMIHKNVTVYIWFQLSNLNRF